MFRLT